MRKFLLLVALLSAAPAALPADEALIRRTMESKLEGLRVEGIQPAPVPGLYEVRFRTEEGVRVVYTDDKATFIFTGNIYEIKTDRQLTVERLRAARQDVS